MTRYKCPACGGNQYSASPHKAQEACIYCGNKGTERHYNSVKDVTTMNHFCTARMAHKRVPGRYARTSPPWCPKRGGGE